MVMVVSCPASECRLLKCKGEDCREEEEAGAEGGANKPEEAGGSLSSGVEIVMSSMGRSGVDARGDDGEEVALSGWI